MTNYPRDNQFDPAATPQPPPTPGRVEIAKPVRRFKIEIVAEGDDFKDALRLLRDLADHVGTHGEDCTMVSGGVSSGGFVRITENPEQTHEQYTADLKAYLDHERDRP